MPLPRSGEALRIGATTNTIAEGLDAWAANMAARGKRPGTIKSFRTLILNAAPVLGWASVSDITGESLMDYMGQKRHDGAWTGTTMNRNLAGFQSFSRFLHKKRWLSFDPLASIDRAEDDGGEGARAATTEEARDLVRYAWERQQLDRRCKGDRALVWLCMFAMGLRASEPEAFTWKCLFLEESVPFIRWTRKMHKAFRTQEVALCPEVVELLLAHRGRVPHGDDDQVFPILPPRNTFRKDRDGAGIAASDRRGRGFSPHSARKWFSHVLTVAGVEGRMVDALMRHSTGTPGRYPDLLPRDQAAAVALVPKLWITSWREENAQNHLTQGQPLGDTPGARPMQTTQHNSVQPARPGVNALVSQLTAPSRRADSSELKAEHLRSTSGLNPPDLIESAEVRSDPVGTTDRQLFGDLLAEGVARMLRKGASDRGRSA